MKKVNLNWFELGALFWIIGSLLTTLFSLLGIFNIYFILLSFALAAAIPFQIYRQKKIVIKKLQSKSFQLLFFVVLIVGILLSFYTTPTIFGGRDEGSYSNAAIILANEGKRTQDTKLIKNFYDIYGQSKALNFPGFQYSSDGNLESQFLPGYPTWLAIFYKLFGLNGLKFVNLLPLITLILSFYLIIIEVFPLIKEGDDPQECLNGNIFKRCLLKLTQAEQFAWVGAIFLLTFMPLSVFYKFTLTEIYYASLAWFSLYLLIRYLKDKRFLKFKLIFIPLILMLFIRIETAAIIFTLLLIMIGKDYSHLKQAKYQFFFVLSGIMLLVLVLIEPNFFINAIKGFSEISGLNANAMPESRESTLMGKLIPDDWKSFYALKIWFNYNILPFFIMSAAFLIVFFRSVWKNMRFGNQKALLVLPFLFFLPTLVYLIDANISLDHPWMLRRWLFAIIPLSFFYSILFLFYLKQRNRLVYRLITAFAIIGNIAIFTIPPQTTQGILLNFFTFSQNEKLFKQTQDLSRLFGEDDLILLSQKSSGSGWSLMAEPMRNIFGQQAVYFFNPEDYAKLDRDDFDNIFLVTTEEEEFLYENITKERIGQRTITNAIVEPSRDPLDKPGIVETEVTIKIYRILE